MKSQIIHLSSKENKGIVEKRKKEFIKRENENRELIINSFGSFVGLTQKGVTVRHEGKVVYQQPLNSLTHITISGKGISLSSNLIEQCMENNISIDFFGYGNRHSGSILSNRLLEENLWNRQACCSKLRRNLLARTIIWAKVKNQLHIAKYFHKYHKKENHQLMDALYDFESFFKDFDSLRKTEEISEDESFIPFLMTIEAQGAMLYWKYIRLLLSDDKIMFEGRVKHGAIDVVNCMLNYGYALIYSRVWQALLKAKLNPFDSVIHARQTGKPTFVYDVVEIFRASVVDRAVVALVQKGQRLTVSDGLLDEKTKGLVSKAIIDRLNRYEVYNGERMTMDSIIRNQAREIAFFFCDGESYFKPYIYKW